MINTSIGPLDGNTWESLIQSVYKRKYSTYQEMIASPGDLGIEGFVLNNGIVIQCYCPSNEYDTKTLHEKQIAKITKDINKLSKYAPELEQHLGQTKIKNWIFVTPRFSKRQIHIHAREKEKEVLSKGLNFIDAEFKILVHDLGFYEQEIRQIQMINGEQLDFSSHTAVRIPEPELNTDYDNNISDKNEIRSYVRDRYLLVLHEKLNEDTKKSYLDGYDIFNDLYRQSPSLYERIVKVINNFEEEIEINCLTWEGTPNELIDYIREKLISRFEKDSFITDSVVHENLILITRHMISRWIAHCPMRIVS